MVSPKIKGIISGILLVGMVIGFGIYASKRSKMIEETTKLQNKLDSAQRGLTKLGADEETQIKNQKSTIETDYAKTNAPFYAFLVFMIVTLLATIYYVAMHYVDKSVHAMMVSKRGATKFYYF